ncbi:MAG TPA: biotin/lipoyl-containing protein [Anaerolineales bacterium]|nr:biotin/lipoyl-containing protein [Anaerolineales bacterium]
MKYTFTYQGKTYELTLIYATATGNTTASPLSASPNGYRVAYQGGEYTLTGVEPTLTGIRFRLNGVAHTLHVSADRDTRWVAFNGHTYALKRETRTRRSQSAGDDNPEGILHAPMPGQVRAVNVQAGDPVTKGQTLLLLVAMKMEIRIQAPCDGTVTKIAVTVGEQVDKEQILLEIGD